MSYDVAHASSFVQLVCERALEHPERLAFRFLADGGSEVQPMRYGELDQRARACAALLQEKGLASERALLVLPPGLDYVVAFLGCLYASVVAVPAYPPDPSRLARTLPRLEKIVEDAEPRVVLTNQALAAFGGAIAPSAPRLSSCEWITCDDIERSRARDWQDPRRAPSSLAFIQYTSGSTSSPRGVMLTHDNLLSNSAVIHRSFGHDTSSHAVIWLPPYHDMGLIGGILQPLFGGFSATLLSPTSFLRKPLRWLHAISRYGGTTSGGPNFAFDLCVRKATADDLEQLDLSRWTVAFNGAEPIRAATLGRFCRAFEPCGFQRSAFFPCYGLAEATLIVSGRSWSEGASVDDDRPVASGPPLPGVEVEVVEPQARVRLAEGAEGEIWVRGRGVGRGYFGQPQLSRQIFEASLASGEGPFLRTGDLGVLRDGELLVSGRIKDLIIYRGRNVYPQDIEQTVEGCDPALRPGGSAAFSVEVEQREEVVVVQEVIDGLGPARADQLVQSARSAVASEHGISVHDVVLVRRGTTPKTSSGKIQRHQCRRSYLDGQLEVVCRARAGDAEGLEEGREVPPTSAAPSEQRVRALAAEVVGLSAEALDPRRPLVAYGLDSIAAIELAARVEPILGVEVPSTAFLRDVPLDEVVGSLRAGGRSLQRPGGPAGRSPEGGQPLSPGQQALWFLHRLDPSSAAYNVAVAVELLGAVDGQALHRAFLALVRRHPELHTGFCEADGAARRRPLEPQVDFEALEVGPLQDAAVEARIRADANTPLDLESGPLVRVRLYRCADARTCLMIAVHHLVVDFWSLVILMDELRVLYPDHRRHGLAEVSARYEHYARGYERDDTQAEVERAWSYWKRRLAPPLPVLSLGDRPRVAGPIRAEGLTHRFELPHGLYQEILRLARAHHVTPYALLLSAYALLLARCSDRDEVMVGTVASGRSPAWRDVVGYFANTVIIRSSFGDDPPFAEFLARNAAHTLDAVEHQSLPFSTLVERMSSRHGPGSPPLVQAVLVYERPHKNPELSSLVLGEPGHRVRWGELDLRSISFDQRITQFELVLNVVEGREGFFVGFQAARDVFDAEQLGALELRFVALLEQIVGNPGARVSEIIAAVDAESRLDHTWNETGGDPHDPRCLHQLVEAAVDAAPDRPAVIQAGRALTYAQLDEHANRLARYLRHQGVGPEVRVGLGMSQRPELVVAMLAIVKAGGVWVPFEPSYPAERIRFMMEDAAVSLLLTEASVEACFASMVPKVVSVDRDHAAWAGEPADRLPAAAQAENLAYVIFTSGSTGRPKAVMTTHRAVCNYLDGMRRKFPYRPDDRALAMAGIGFDASVSEIFTPLVDGAAVVLPLADELGDPARLVTRVRSDAVTCVQLVPSLLRALLDEPNFSECKSLRRVWCGGEAVPTELQDRLLALHDLTMVNVYGPTEATIDPGHFVCRPGQGRFVVPVGYPSQGMRIYLLDPELRPVATGVVGEAYFAGLGLARGYLERPGLTADRFVPDPFAEPGSRMYRSGDLLRRRADGALEFMGRADAQVKIRGFRVELGEIGSKLREHPGVRDAAVVVFDSAERGKQLVAHLVLSEHEAPRWAALREALRRQLPEHMVPASHWVHEALPLSPNGKIDRRRLEQLSPDAPLAKGARPLQGPLEATVAQVFEGVLGVEGVGPDDDFFELGGHSLVATRVASRLGDALGVAVPLRTLFEASTVAALAQRVASLRGAGPRVEPIVVCAERRGALPLSFAQQRLWILDRIDAHGSGYAVPGLVSIEGPVRAERLREVLMALVERHEVLRTCFPDDAGRPRQQVLARLPEPASLPLIDLSDYPPPEQRRIVHEEGLARATEPFDLTRPPLLRAALMRLGAERHVLVLVLHHIIADGVSVEILARELLALYHGQSLPEPALHLVDYAVWERQWLDERRLGSLLSYWCEVLDGMPEELVLPTDRPRSATPSPEGQTIDQLVPDGLVGPLEQLGQEEGATLFTVMLAAFEVLLWHDTGQDDLVVGTPFANRWAPGAEDLVGCLVNTLVLRAHVDPQRSYRELVRELRATVLDAHDHQQLPFECLVDALNPRREFGVPPLVQVAFVYEANPLPVLELGGLRLQTESLDVGMSKFDLTLGLERTSEGYVASWEFSADLFDRSTIEGTARRFFEVLRRVAARPDDPIEQLDLVPAAERQALLARCARARAEVRTLRVSTADAIGRVRSAAAREIPPAGANSSGGDVESVLASIWSEVLGLRGAVVRDQSFFDLGGNSLLAIQIVSRVRARLGLELSLRALFDEPTLAGLAAAVGLAVAAEAEAESPVPRSSQELASMLEKVDELDEEQVDRLLSELEGHGA